jgi:O-antigen ligase
MKKLFYLCSQMILKTLRTSDKPLIYSLMLLAFLVPLHKKLIVPAFILFAFFLLFRFSFAQLFQNIKTKTALLLPMLFYCLSALSLLWTENMSDGLFDLEVKLSFLLLPLLFLMMPFATDEKHTEKILKTYVIGVFVGITICLIWATFQYIKQPVIYYTFVSSRLSIFHHPTYFAMYVNLALIILLYFQRTKKIHHIHAFAGAAILLSFIWLLMSRSGLVTAVIIVFFYWISLFFEKKFKAAIIILLVFVSSVFVMAHFSN